ncbi:histidine kinase [Chryseolinea sp. T2]|uniref:sensor histidine kinase n=1 Tax=Chryseolinea sp. T2 TaxID=3129255 RepID=UPI00307821B7
MTPETDSYSQRGNSGQAAHETAEIALNDRLMRAIGIPFFGIAIPNLTGLFGNLSIHDLYYWIGYLYFIGLAFCIWQGNRYLLFRTRKRFTWFDKPIEKLILLFMNNIFFTSPLTIAWLCVWYQWVEFPEIKWEVITTVTLVNVICVLFVTHVYETVFMVKEQQSEQLRSARLLKAKAEAELEALKNQIDPHFMFNSLNSLTYLIDADPSRARQFTEHLAEVFRYILMQKERTLVMVEDELAFVRHYVTLLQLRFGSALEIVHHLAEGSSALIPPISAFVALENAVKHNEISTRIPLRIDMTFDDGDLVIQNRLQPKRSIQHSSGIGLKNLDERFFIITGKRIRIENDGKHFTVRMPLLSSG